MNVDLQWRRLTAALALTGVAITATAEAPAVPPDVARFVARRDQCDQCDHFRGEEAYDAQRVRFLAKQTTRYCTGTDRALAALKHRHEGDPRAMKLLGDYAVSIEGY